MDLRGYCDSVIDGNEIRGILNNSNVIGANLASHDTDIKAGLAQHDVDIKALLAIVQKSVDEANQRLKVAEALERQTIKLLLTPEGLRAADPAVLVCTGDNAEAVLALARSARSRSSRSRSRLRRLPDAASPYPEVGPTGQRLLASRVAGSHAASSSGNSTLAVLQALFTDAIVDQQPPHRETLNQDREDHDGVGAGQQQVAAGKMRQ